MNSVRLLCLSGFLCLTGACTVTPTPTRHEPNYRPVWPNLAAPQAVSAGSLFQTGGSLALFNDRRATELGDVVTILLQESTRSSKSAATSISKESSNEILNPRIFGSSVRGTGATDIFNSLESANGFSGSGDSDQSNSLSGTISAVVTDVLPNGLLLVQGEKWFQLNRGEEYVRVSGLVRAEDIGPDNAVSSQRLADARIAYSGTGEVAQSNQPGWLTRFFLGTVNPF